MSVKSKLPKDGTTYWVQAVVDSSNPLANSLVFRTYAPGFFFVRLFTAIPPGGNKVNAFKESYDDQTDMVLSRQDLIDLGNSLISLANQTETEDE